MKTLLALVVGPMALLGAGATLAQGGNMMNGGTWGGGWMGPGWMSGYGGIWTILLVIVVAGLVAWIFKRGGK